MTATQLLQDNAPPVGGCSLKPPLAQPGYAVVPLGEVLTAVVPLVQEDALDRLGDALADAASLRLIDWRLARIVLDEAEGALWGRPDTDWQRRNVIAWAEYRSRLEERGSGRRRRSRRGAP